MAGYKKPIVQRIEDNKLVKIEKRLIEIFRSALLQLINADNKEERVSVEQFSNTAGRIGIELLRLYNLQLQKGLFDEKDLNQKIYLVEQIREYIEKKEYKKLATLIEKLKS